MPIGVEVPSQKKSEDHPLIKEIEHVTGLAEAKKDGGVRTPAETTWVDDAFIKGQFQDKDLWEYDEVAVALYDLTKAKDLKSYSKIIQDSFKEDPAIIVLDEQKQFCQNSENWKILIQFAKIKYKKFVDKPDEKAST